VCYFTRNKYNSYYWHTLSNKWSCRGNGRMHATWCKHYKVSCTDRAGASWIARALAQQWDSAIIREQQSACAVLEPRFRKIFRLSLQLFPSSHMAWNIAFHFESFCLLNSPKHVEGPYSSRFQSITIPWNFEFDSRHHAKMNNNFLICFKIAWVYRAISK